MRPFETFSNRVASAASAGWDLLSAYPASKKARWVSGAILALLFVAGVFWWGAFFRWGRYPMDFQDWLAVSAPRFFFLRSAVIHLQLPLHMTEKSLLGGVTTRYMSIPDAFLSPQLVLLRYLSVERFIFLDIVGMYTLGFTGLLWIRKRFSLSLAAFTLLFFLFNFNGHIIAHLSIGHETWGGYFLFSWFVVLMLDLLDGDHSWLWVLKVAGLLFIILLQGSYHQVVWALFFLGFISIAKKGCFIPAIKAAAATVLLGAVRFLPVTLEAGAFDQTYHGGFLSLADLWNGLVNLRAPASYVSSALYFKPLGGWEFTLYIGLAGALFLAFFGGYRWLSNRGGDRRYPALLLPILGLTFLSFHAVFAALRGLPFPLFSGERVPARIISVPFVFLLVLAVIEFQRWLDQERANVVPRVAVFAGVTVLTLHDLWENLSTWSILKVQPVFDHGILFYNKWVVANAYDDTVYIRTLIIGAAISSVCLLALLGLAWRERKRAQIVLQVIHEKTV
ncbi:MAG TPA: hypothetical protein VGJ97_12745 [Anaerolineaceae bacterium]